MSIFLRFSKHTIFLYVSDVSLILTSIAFYVLEPVHDMEVILAMMFAVWTAILAITLIVLMQRDI